MASEEELDAQIEKLHGPGAVEALNKAYADGSIFSESSRDEDRGLYQKHMVARLDVYTPPGTSTRESRRSPAIVYQDEQGLVQGIQLLDEETRPGMFLCFDDPAAQDAFYVYANSVKAKQPKLAADIKEQITQAIERAVADLEYGAYIPGSGDDGVLVCANYEEAKKEEQRGLGVVVYRSPGEEGWHFEVPQVQEENGEEFKELAKKPRDPAMAILNTFIEMRKSYPLDAANKPQLYITTGQIRELVAVDKDGGNRGFSEWVEMLTDAGWHHIENWEEVL